MTAITNASELLALLIESQDGIGGDWRARRDAAVVAATARTADDLPPLPPLPKQTTRKVDAGAFFVEVSGYNDKQMHSYARDYALSALAAAPQAVLATRYRWLRGDYPSSNPGYVGADNLYCGGKLDEAIDFVMERAGEIPAASSAAATQASIDPEAERIADDEEYPR